MPKLTSDAYGKSKVRLLKVKRSDERHEIVELTARVKLLGDFAAAYTDGDNSAVLPTDTMKNTVYALALDHPIDSIESFAMHLARHFHESHDPVVRAEVELVAGQTTQLDFDTTGN